MPLDTGPPDMGGTAPVLIDHVNIRTDRLEEACAFYERLLLLTRDAPPGLDPARYAWLRNGAGHAVIHIASPSERDGDDGEGTGALHHVAFSCSDYDTWRSRIDAMGLSCEVNDFPAASLRQLFVIDPDGIRLEFNFHDMPQAAFARAPA